MCIRDRHYGPLTEAVGLRFWNRHYPYFQPSSISPLNRLCSPALQVWVTRIAALRPTARLAVSSRQCRRDCPFLAAAYTCQLWDFQHQTDTLLGVPCRCGNLADGTCGLCGRPRCGQCRLADGLCNCRPHLDTSGSDYAFEDSDTDDDVRVLTPPEIALRSILPTPCRTPPRTERTGS